MGVDGVDAVVGGIVGLAVGPVTAGLTFTVGWRCTERTTATLPAPIATTAIRPLAHVRSRRRCARRRIRSTGCGDGAAARS
ncbi:MAG: hypothetical protein JWM72_4456 [Actinomycetia bacterium]|nr:hypothetical protein [Actinomycetes bacterium]MDQ1460018.1 hypothetical protein [Actinomycetota bacterium]